MVTTTIYTLWRHLSHEPATEKYSGKLHTLKPVSHLGLGALLLSCTKGPGLWGSNPEASTVAILAEGNPTPSPTLTPQQTPSSPLSTQLWPVSASRPGTPQKYTFASFSQTEEKPDLTYSVDPQTALSAQLRGKEPCRGKRGAEDGLEAPKVGIDTSTGMPAKLSLKSIRYGHHCCCQVTYAHSQQEYQGGEKEN